MSKGIGFDITSIDINEGLYNIEGLEKKSTTCILKANSKLVIEIMLNPNVVSVDTGDLTQLEDTKAYIDIDNNEFLANFSLLSSVISLKQLTKNTQLTLVFGLDAKAGGTSGGVISNTDKAGGTSNKEIVKKTLLVSGNDEDTKSKKSIYLELRIENF